MATVPPEADPPTTIDQTSPTAWKHPRDQAPTAKQTQTLTKQQSTPAEEHNPDTPRNVYKIKAAAVCRQTAQ